MPLTASYRGRVTTVSGTGNADSNPISVNADDMLVVAVHADSYRDLTTASVTMTWPDTRGFTYWIDHAYWGNSYDGSYVQIAAYRCPTAGNPGIHVVTSGSAQGHRRPSFEIWTVSGYDLGSPVVGTGVRDTYGDPINATLGSGGGVGNTIAIVSGADGSGTGAAWISGAGITAGWGYTQPTGGGEPGISAFSTVASWTAPNTNQPLQIDPPSTAWYALAWMEFRPAPVPPPVVGAGADASLGYPGPFTRTATESSGVPITLRSWNIWSGPTGVGTVIGSAAALSWTPPQVGVYVLRYAADNAYGTGTDDVTVTVNTVVPTVDAGLDRTVERTKGIIRTAGEPSTGGATITARQWRLMSGPAGSGAPVNLAAYGGDPTRCLLPNSVAGAHVIRYTATNSVGGGYDEATITVTPLRPTVDAGPDEARGTGLFTRTAQETAGDSAITSRRWYVVDGPSLVGSTIGSAAALSWTPPTLGRWVLGYTATSSAGTSDPDTATVTVGVTGVVLSLGRTPEPKIAVTIAFGGDLTDPDGSSWVFTEVTTDVRAANGIYLKHGASDEAAGTQPAQCRFTLANPDGRYSLGGRSPYWPNVRQGVPVQVSADLGSGFSAQFTGYVDGFTPGYSTVPLRTSGGTIVRGDAIVTVSASGALRRLGQGNPPVLSPLYRAISNASGLVAYWPCEDEKNSTNFASALPGQPPMEYVQRLHAGSNPNAAPAKPRPAASDLFTCSLPLPLISDSEWYGNVLPYTVTANLQCHFLLSVPASGTLTGCNLIGIVTGGDPYFWELGYGTGGTINIRAWRTYAPYLVEDRVVSFNIDGKLCQFGLTLTQSGGNVNYQLDLYEVGATTGFTYNNTVTSATLGMASRVQTSTNGGNFDVAMGHINLRTAAWNLAEHMNFVNAWSGDQVGQRFLRVTGDALLGYTQLDGSVPYDNITDYMGPQRAGTIVQLLRDCETCDTGTLWDGETPGVTYTTKRYRESRAPALTLDAARGEIALPFQPAHDDAYRVNRAVASRREGASASYIDNTGPLGANIVGRYDDSRTVDCRDDTALPQYASWMVFQGTVEGYRYPRLSLDLRAHPELLDEWLALSIGDRIDVVNLSAIHPSAPVETLSLTVEGYEQTITPRSWTVTLNTSLARRWQVGQFTATTTGGTSDPRSEYAGRWDTDGATIAALCTAGQQSLTVNTPSGPLWTTAADDYPLYLDIGAVRVLATACTAGGVSGNARWQTFTTEPLPVSRAAGTAVGLWQPAVLGL